MYERPEGGLGFNEAEQASFEVPPEIDGESIRGYGFVALIKAREIDARLEEYDTPASGMSDQEIDEKIRLGLERDAQQCFGNKLLAKAKPDER
jgi:hypothetical protein